MTDEPEHVGKLPAKALLSSNQAQDVLLESERFLKSVIDGLSDNIAVLDHQGSILLTNKSYRDFGVKNCVAPSAVTSGTNYLAVCDSATGEHAEEAKLFAQGIREVLSGKRQSFQMEYSCHSPDEKRWFIGRVTPFTWEDCRRVIVAHGNITSVKRAEDELRVAKELSSRIIEDGPVAITLVNRDGKIIFANRHAEQLFGLEKPSLETLVYNAPDWLITDIDGSSFSDEQLPFRRVMSTGQAVYDVQHAITLPNSARKILSINGAPLHDGQGQINRVVFAIQDITERLLAEEHLHKFKQIVSSTSDGISLLDTNYRYVILNKAYETFSGKKQEELLGVSVAEYLGEAVFLEKVKSHFDRCLKGEPIRYQDWFEFPVLGKRFIEVSYFPYIDAKGNISGVVANTRDITERKQAEDALNDKEKQISSIFRSAPVGIGLVSNRVLKAVNARFCEMTGYEEQDLLNQSARMLYPDDGEFDYVGREKYAQIADRGTGDVETHWQKKDGTIIDILLSSTPIDLSDWSRGVTFTALDITDRKQAERSLQQKKHEVEQFAYMVSHDLKSPLITIRTFLAMLRKDLLGSEQQQIDEDMNYIDQAADKMHLLLEALLQYSRIGRKDSLPQTLSVSQQVEKCLTILAGILLKKEVEVSTRGLSCQFYGDPLHFGQIWQNLIENAVKYMGGQAHPQIEIGTIRKGDEVVFYVRDNGMGIATEHHGRIFNLFTKLDANSKGSGLGLAQVKKIVELYSGRIWVESEGPGRGSCFYFTLPGAVKKMP